MGRDALKITVVSYDGTDERFLGNVQINLTDLQDQKKKIRQQYALQDQKLSEEPWNGVIILSLQYICNRTQYLDDLLKELQLSIDENRKQLNTKSIQLDSLQAPFGSWGVSSSSIDLPYIN